MIGRMEFESSDELISSIATNVMKCLMRCGLFEKLDGLLSPENASIPPQRCDGTYKLSKSILIAAGFDRAELDDIFDVLQSKGGNCDCEVLYNVAETNRLKASYWRGRAAKQIVRAPHIPPSRPN
jgi:hypothetical protein